MSYDVQVWSVHPASSFEYLPNAINWKHNEGSALYEKRAWAISFLPSVRVLPEDVPIEVSSSLPGIEYLSEINLSPIDAPEVAKKFAMRTAIAIAKASHGVIFDPQNNAVTLPSGVRRYVKPQPNENASILALSWWFVDGPLVDGSYSGLLDVLSAELPEAMPRRYGLFEPPQHVYANEGRDHFLKFLADNAKGVGTIWYPSGPVFNVSLRLPSPLEPQSEGSGREHCRSTLTLKH
jgi:hypothetical protein